MQLKNMREILPNLCIDQGAERNDVLVSSLIQASKDKVIQLSTHDAHSFSQVAEAEGGKPSLFLCKNCCSFFELSPQDLPRPDQLSRTEEKNAFLCSSCSLSLSVCFSDMNGACVNIDKEKCILGKMEEKTVNAVRLEKYHCDKCRFTTKDHLQYQKHAFLHEEIKFICSHCNYVSYTKGEFQRHLVKHTGTFPYKCEYCAYGAVRNDYIVKHTKRVHEVTSEIHPANSTAACLDQRTLHKERVSELKSSFQTTSNSSADLGCHDIRSETWSTLGLFSNVEYNKLVSIKENDVKSNVNRGSFLKVEEDDVLEVELISPVDDPLLPEMTLTAVAPPDLVLPSHTFAQLVEVKMMDGKQQLVLKLFPQNERCFEIVNTERCCNICPDIDVQELNNKVSAEQTGLLITNKASEENLSLNCTVLSPKPEDCKISSSEFCSDSFSSNKTLIAVPINHTVGEEPLKVLNFKSNITNAFSESQGIYDSEIKGCHKSYIMDKQAEDSSSRTNTCISLLSACQSKVDLAQIVLDSENGCSSPQTDLCINDKGAVNEASVGIINTSLSNTYMTKEPMKISATGRDSSFSKTVSYPEVNSDHGYSSYQSPDNLSFPLASLEEFSINTPEGPYISSVFSLSSDAENLPEGIKWDENPPYKTEPRIVSSRSASVTDESMTSPLSVFVDKPLHCNDSALMNGSVSVDGHSNEPTFLWKGKCLQKDANYVRKYVHQTDISLDNCCPSDVGKCDDEGFSLENKNDACLPKQSVSLINCKWKSNSETESSHSSSSRSSKVEEMNVLTVHLKASENVSENCCGNEFFPDANRNVNVTDCSKEAYSVLEKDENGPNRSINRENVELNVQAPDFLCSKNQLESSLVCKENENVNVQLLTAAGPQNSEQCRLQLPFHLETEANSVMKQNASVNETDQNAVHQDLGTQNEPSKKEQLHFNQAPAQVRLVKSKRSLAKNLHIDNPIFIPKGTVLRVVNSKNNNATDMDKSTNVSVHSVTCNETLLPRPVPFTTSEKLVDLPLSNKKELYKLRNPRRSFNYKLGQELHLKCTTTLDGKCDDLNKQKAELKRPASPQNKIKRVSSENHFLKKKVKLQPNKDFVYNEKEILTRARRLRLMPVSVSQLIKCPRRNQPVVVLNHPDVDSLEVVNVMKTISKYKANVLKVFLSERTIYCLGIKQHQKRLMYQSWEIKASTKELKMKLKKFQKSNCQEAGGITDDSLQCMFKCWFCGRSYENQEDWISHGQRHLIEATRDWDVLFPSKTHN